MYSSYLLFEASTDITVLTSWTVVINSPLFFYDGIKIAKKNIYYLRDNL